MSAAGTVALASGRRPLQGISAARLLAVCVALSLAAALFAVSPALGGAGRWLREGAYLGTLALLVALAAQLLRRTRGMLRRTWLLVALLGVIWMAAEVAALLVRTLAAEGESFAWLALGVLSLLAYALLLLAGLRYAARSSRTEWVLGLLDSSLLVLAVGAPWMQFVVLEHMPDADRSRLLPLLILPAVAGALLLTGALLVYAAAKVQACAIAVLLALAAAVVGDVLASLRLLHGFTRADGALVAWEVRAALFCVVAALAGAPPLARRRWLVRAGVLRLAIVVAGFGLTLGVATLAFGGGNVVWPLAIGSYAVAALVARFLVHAFSRQLDAERLRQALHEQEQLAVVDPLTGLFNRRFFDAQLKLELDRAARSQGTVGLLVIDLDHFKRTNDTYGHLAGDDILRDVARRLLAAVRNGDIVARYGGEEFVVLLPGGGALQLREIGERCRLAIGERPIRLTDGRQLRTTVSVGGATWPDDALSVRDLFHSADIALYRAKELGRDCVQLSEARGPAGAEPLPAVVAAQDGAGAELTPGLLGPSAYEPHAPGMARWTQDGAGSELAAGSFGPPAHEPYAPGTARWTQDGAGAELVAGLLGPPARAPHAPSMARWARLAARALGLDPAAQERCAVAARFHDVGKYVVPESILAKQGPLTRLEWEVVRMHPEYGAWLIELVPGFRGVGRIIREHHERVDGRGYPEGKRQEEISSEARIVAVCDAWSAMRGGRPYASAKTESEARAELLAARGSQFDARIVETFLMFGEADVAGEEEPLPALPAREPQAPVA